MTTRAWRAALAVAVALQSLALYWPRTPSISPDLPLDKGVHLLLFGGVAFLGVLARIPLRWLAAGLVLQAAVSELLQGMLPGRGADPVDFLFDLLGAALGVGAGLLLRRRAVR